METLENVVISSHDWAVDRIHYLAESDVANAYAVQCEFSEWLDPDIEDHNVFSLEYIGD